MVSLLSLLMLGLSEILYCYGYFFKYDFFFLVGVVERFFCYFMFGLIRCLVEGFYYILSGVEEIFCFWVLELMCSLISSFLLVF